MARQVELSSFFRSARSMHGTFDCIVFVAFCCSSDIPSPANHNVYLSFCDSWANACLRTPYFFAPSRSSVVSASLSKFGILTMPQRAKVSGASCRLSTVTMSKKANSSTVCAGGFCFVACARACVRTRAVPRLRGIAPRLDDGTDG